MTVDIWNLFREMSFSKYYNEVGRFAPARRSDENPAQGTSSQISSEDQRRSAYVIKRNSNGFMENSNNQLFSSPPITSGGLKKRLDEVQKRLENQFRQNPHAPIDKTTKATSGNLKQEYVEQTDESSGSDDDDDDHDGIINFFTDIKKHKKEMKKLKREKKIFEQTCKNELDQMIVVHKRLASELDRKHNQEKMAMRNNHARQRQQLTDLNKVKLESIVEAVKDTSQKLKITRKVLKGTIKRKYEQEEDEEDFAPECPLCMEIMTPPKKIYQCSEGHLVCSVCKPKMQNNICATCRNDNGYNSRCRWIEDNIAKRMRNE